MVPLLPQNDQNLPVRQHWLDENRSQYRYDHNYLPPLPMLESVPHAESFSAEYTVKRFPAVAPIVFNAGLARIRSIFDPFDQLDDFEDLFTILPAPASIQWWRSDDAFADQRLAGPNPLMIRRLTAAGELPFAVSDSMIPGVNNTVDAAIKSGRLYLCDYGELAFVQGGSHARGRKYLPTPRAVFFWSSSGYSDRGQLMPVAIQVVKDGRVLTTHEANALDWLVAKLSLQIADANHHEMSSHLCRTHLVMEPFAIASARQLAQNHPLGILLRPHFRFMLANNELGRKQLIQRGGPVERLLAGTLEESLTIVTNAYRSWKLAEHSFPQEIKNRKMDDVGLLPHYLFRDDGMLLWQALAQYVRAYLGLYYRTTADLANDQELQSWATELADPNQGRVAGMPPTIPTLDALVPVVTQIIFTCGPLHGAVNFSQYDFMAFAPNMPLAAYCPWDDRAPAFQQDQDLMRFLPPAGPAVDQLGVMDFLTSFHYDRLGFYEDGDFTDPAALAVVEAFQRELDRIEHEIDRRNARRHIAYRFLKPSEILNSISI